MPALHGTLCNNTWGMLEPKQLVWHALASNAKHRLAAVHSCHKRQAQAGGCALLSQMAGGRTWVPCILVKMDFLPVIIDHNMSSHSAFLS